MNYLYTDFRLRVTVEPVNSVKNTSRKDVSDSKKKSGPGLSSPVAPYQLHSLEHIALLLQYYFLSFEKR